MNKKSIHLITCLCVLFGFIHPSVYADQPASLVIDLDAAGFIEKIFDYKNENVWRYKGEKPAVVMFSASWCNPCQETLPILAINLLQLLRNSC